jgi:hypothetical protein
MTKEKFDYIIETLREIKARSEERGYSGEVEALDAAISKLIATRWIPCSEKLPDYSWPVLVCFEDDSIDIAQRIDPEYYRKNVDYADFVERDEVIWFDNQMNDRFLYGNPVKWMPLPLA